MAAVYFADISKLPAEASALPLSEYRTKKLDRLLHAEKRRQSIGAELLLILALKEYGETPVLPLTITSDVGGKPELCGMKTKFNLSHSGDYAACALAGGRVGVDIQRAEEYKSRLAARVFTQGEIRRIEKRGEDFTRLWTLKESYLKYLGTGLKHPMNTVEILFRDGGEPYVRGDAGCRLWHWTANGYHIALCAPAEEMSAALKEISIDRMRR